MEASKIQFSQATKAALIARPMSKTAKAKIRRERVKDYIRSQPVGTIIKQTDLAVVAGYDKSQGHGWAFINRMVKNKHIAKDTSEGASRPSWTVVGDSKTVKPKREEVQISEMPMPSPRPDILDSTIKKVLKNTPKFEMKLDSVDQLSQVSAGWAMQKAKDFAWAYNSDSLRDFIKWLDTTKEVK